jgi:hypothetical protein
MALIFSRNCRENFKVTGILDGSKEFMMNDTGKVRVMIMAMTAVSVVTANDTSMLVNC